MKRIVLLAMGLVLAAASTASLAFEEHKEVPPATPPAASAPGGAAGAAALGIATPELAVPKDTGTKIRVPGLGVIGEIPKMDFGLELLYGAQQARPTDPDRSEANGVMLRGTVPLKSR